MRAVLQTLQQHYGLCAEQVEQAQTQTQTEGQRGTGTETQTQTGTETETETETEAGSEKGRKGEVDVCLRQLLRLCEGCKVGGRVQALYVCIFATLHYTTLTSVLVTHSRRACIACPVLPVMFCSVLAAGAAL